MAVEVSRFGGGKKIGRVLNQNAENGAGLLVDIEVVDRFTGNREGLRKLKR